MNLWSIAVKSVKQRALRAGDYFVDRGMASKSLRVESDLRVESIQTKTEWVDPGETIFGSVKINRPLQKGESIHIEAVDTWNRIVAKTNIRPDSSFAIRAMNPLSELWDIRCVIEDREGIVQLENAAHITVTNCTLFNSGHAAVNLGHGDSSWVWAP